MPGSWPTLWPSEKEGEHGDETRVHHSQSGAQGGGHRPGAAGHRRDCRGHDSSGPPAVADAPRYWFECWGPGYLIGEFSSVEEVWAAPGYMEITDVRVRFKGAGPRLLLPDEEAAIAAAERTLRRTVADPAATLLSALQLSSRTPLDRLGDSLGAAGAAAVVAALELHPEAPQAGLLRHWLQS